MCSAAPGRLGAVVRLEPRPFAGSSARPDVEAVGSSEHPLRRRRSGGGRLGGHLRAAKGGVAEEDGGPHSATLRLR
jgi:hypothetical protein